MMPSKIIEIKKMLLFLAQEYDYDDCIFRQKEPGIYYWEKYFNSISLPEYKERDEYWATIDIKQEKVSWEAAFTSGHNGSSYGTISGEIPLENIYFDLVSSAKNRAAKMMKKEADLSKARMEEEALENFLSQKLTRL